MKSLVLLNHLSMSPPIAELHAGVANELRDKGNQVILSACDGSFLPCDHNQVSSKARCLLCKRTAVSISKELQLPIVWINESKFNINGNKLAVDHDTSSRIKLGVQSTIASLTRSPDEKYLNKFWTTYGEKLTNTSVSLYQSLLKIIDIESIEEIYMFNGRFAFASAALSAALESGIDYYVYDQERTKTSFRMFHNTSLHDMSENCKRAINYYNSNPERAEEVSLKLIRQKRNNQKTYEQSYTTKQKSGMLKLYLKNNNINNYISIFPSSDDEYKYLSASWKMDIVDQLESIANIANNNQSITFLVRMHPNMNGMPKKAINDYYNLGLKYQNIHIISPRNKISTYEVLDMSDMVIVFCSTIGVESAYVGKNTIGIGPNPFLDLNIFPIYRNSDDIKLDNFLPPKPDKKSSIIWLNYLSEYSDKNRYLSWNGKKILYKNRNFNKGFFGYLLAMPSRIYLEIILGRVLITVNDKIKKIFGLMNNNE